MDQRTDEGNEQQHQRTERIGQEAHVDMQIAHRKPGEDVMDEKALLGRHAFQVNEDHDRQEERQQRSDAGQGAVQLFGQRVVFAGKHMQQPDDYCTNERKQGYQAQICCGMFHEITPSIH
ncbi:MAG: hypothetical protein ACD_75C00152G0001 [uncultured bacterium]|nr:MAG: hypothetical protein ACD_75C00152G0001 [uncultured bacterium]